MVAVSEQEYITRIKALGHLNASLAAQVDRQGKVVEAALAWAGANQDANNVLGEQEAIRLVEAVDIYEREIAELTGEGRDGPSES